jgi:hypothetical protein
MGASGYSAFENDDAMDWLAELEGAEDTSILEDAFDAILEADEDYVEIPEASVAIAAAEVVAALLGRAATLLPEVAMEWIQKQGEVQFTIIEQARSAVNRVLDDSELQGVWEDSDNYDNWKTEVNDLLRRLA